MGVHDKRVSDDRKTRAVTRDRRVYVFPSCHATVLASEAKSRSGQVVHTLQPTVTVKLSAISSTRHVCYLALG